LSCISGKNGGLCKLFFWGVLTYIYVAWIQSGDLRDHIFHLSLVVERQRDYHVCCSIVLWEVAYIFCLINFLRIVPKLIECNGWSLFPQKPCACVSACSFCTPDCTCRSYSNELTNCKGMFGTPLSFILAVYILCKPFLVQEKPKFSYFLFALH